MVVGVGQVGVEPVGEPGFDVVVEESEHHLPRRATRWTGSRRQQIPRVAFGKGHVMHEQLKLFDASERAEGVLFIGKTWEKTQVFRTEKRGNPDTGKPYPVDRAVLRWSPRLPVLPRRRLRPVLPQVLHLLPLHREPASERALLGLTLSRQGRDRLHRDGQTG